MSPIILRQFDIAFGQDEYKYPKNNRPSTETNLIRIPEDIVSKLNGNFPVSSQTNITQLIEKPNALY